MRVGSKHTYGRIPYWKHNGHTVTVVEVTAMGDGTSDATLQCDCSQSWSVAIGVDHSEEAPEC